MPSWEPVTGLLNSAPKDWGFSYQHGEVYPPVNRENVFILSYHFPIYYIGKALPNSYLPASESLDLEALPICSEKLKSLPVH